MDAMTLLHNRNSAPKLSEPAPSGAELNAIFRAALRAPDHAKLTPWRFLTIKGEARNQLGDLFVATAQQKRQQSGQLPMTEQESRKMAAKPLRAPLIIVVIATLTEHPKVPAIEQRLSAGCAAHGILLAAHAQGFAGIWRTGSNCFERSVMTGLGLANNEEIIGFIYLGTVTGSYKPLRELAVEDYCQVWPPKT